MRGFKRGRGALTFLSAECLESTLTIVGDPGSTVWFWVGPDSFQSPDGSSPYEFDYTLWLNLDTVATENHSWSAVKALFD